MPPLKEVRVLEEKEKRLVTELFKNLKNPVKLINFTQELECQFCRETRKLLKEVSELSDKVSLEVYNFQLDKEKVSQYGVDKIPATVIEGDKDYGIRYYGMITGYEFAALLQDIVDLSERESGLSQNTKEQLKKLYQKIHLQVFTTPTCPYCARATSLAHKFALESDFLMADVIEAMEFPHLVNKYGVLGVPKTMINEQTSIEGSLPEDKFLSEILKAVQTSV
jgi:glutaredoxin-like protein